MIALLESSIAGGLMPKLRGRKGAHRICIAVWAISFRREARSAKRKNPAEHNLEPWQLL
jgi:hypothetical protein